MHLRTGDSNQPGGAEGLCRGERRHVQPLKGAGNPGGFEPVSVGGWRDGGKAVSYTHLK